MANLGKSLQGNIKQYDGKDMHQYSLFMGGLNVKHNALKQYSPLKTGYARIFLVKMPEFMLKMYEEKTKHFRHLIEYGFVSVDGIQNKTLEFSQITGGYAGRSFDVATVAKDDTNEITIKVYEFAGSPVREYLDLWISGISDPYTGLSHYHGAFDEGVKFAQHNHTMEAFYINTDPTGRHDGIEHACLLVNMMPKSVRLDQFNYQSGTHDIVEMDITFTCVKYESRQINEVARTLIAKYNLLRDYLDFESDYSTNAVPSTYGITGDKQNPYNYDQSDFQVKTPHGQWGIGQDGIPESEINDWTHTNNQSGTPKTEQGNQNNNPNA